MEESQIDFLRGTGCLDLNTPGRPVSLKTETADRPYQHDRTGWPWTASCAYYLPGPDALSTLLFRSCHSNVCQQYSVYHSLCL